MTNGTTQGLFIVVAIVIFGIFVGLSQTLFGKQLTNDLVAIFEQSTEQNTFDKNKDYNVEDVVPNAESDFIFDDVNKIIGYKGSSTEVVIPKTINNKTVTSISGDAFNDKNITKIIMPNSITTIEDGSIVIEPQEVASTYSFRTSENSIKVVGAFANNDIQELSVSANIKYIGSYAFFNGELDAVILPEGLKSIGEGSFEQDNLTKINIPSTVENIGDNAFKDNVLKDVNYAKGSLLKNIGTGVFSNNNLDTITIPSGVSKIPDNAYSNSGLKEVIIPEGITSIGKDAFSNNELTKVVIPEGVKEIEEGAFKENEINNLELPNGLEVIGDYAFYKNQLPVIQLPNSLLSVGKYAFYSNKLSFVEIPNKLSVIREWTFAYNQLPSKPEIPANIKTEEENAFYGNLFSDEKQQSDYYNGKDLVITDEKGFEFDKATGTITKYKGTVRDVVIPYEIDGVKVQHIGASSFPSNITSVVIPDTVKTIGSRAFYGDKYSSLKSITLGNSVEVIGDNAFFSSGAPKIVIPNSVKTIGKSAFTNIYGAFLNDLVLGTSVETIGADAFDGNNMTSITVPQSVKSIGRDAFNSINKITINFDDYNFQPELDPYGIADKYTYVYKQPFKFDKETKTITGYMGDSNLVIPTEIYGVPVEHIGPRAFEYSSGNSRIKTTELTIPNTVKTIGKSAFSNTSINKLVIGNSVTHIDDGAFASSQVNDLTLGDSVEVIGKNAFVNSKIVNLVIPDSVKRIEESAFAFSKIIEYSTIKTIKLGNSLEYIGVYAFKTAAITELYVPRSVKVVDNSAFWGALYLRNVNIQNTVGNITIGSRGFHEAKPTYLGY